VTKGRGAKREKQAIKTKKEVTALKEETETTAENTQGKEAIGTAEEPDSLKDRVSELENAAAEKDRRIAGLEQALTEAGKQQESLGNSLSRAIASYRTLITETNTNVPAELLGGDTIEAIDDSLARARTLVEKIKQGMEAETAAIHVPGGAPVRTGTDLSGLSPIEKIKYAVSKKQK
jgi:uncharacterized coiled-coil protein SlyX